jgi:hypothetical protein
MLKLSADSSGTASVIQTNERPTVYMDHGLLMSIAEDTNLATRFIVTLKNQHGTLALSWVNLAEFAKITDQRQVRAVEQFVDAISPQLFFIAVDPWAVIQSENEVLQGRRIQSEWGHLGLLRALSEGNTIPQPLDRERSILEFATPPYRPGSRQVGRPICQPD